MFNDNVYIANSEVKPDLPQFDMSEIPPIPAFQMQSDMPVDEPIPFYFTSHFMLGALILICILFFFLIGAFVKMRKHARLRKRMPKKAKQIQKKPLPVKNNKPVSVPAKKADVKVKQKEVKSEKEKIPLKEASQPELKEAFNIKKQNENAAEKELAAVNNSDNLIETAEETSTASVSLHLGTPKNVHNCIKNFLEITLET